MMMTRSVKGRVRYYSVELLPNLFDEWILIRSYGSMKSRRPTGVIEEFYADKAEASLSLHRVIEKKMGRGYVPLMNKADEL